MYKVITFYEFKDMPALGRLEDTRAALLEAMAAHGIKGTILIAEEGFNSTVCGREADMDGFVTAAGEILETKLNFKASFHEQPPFRKSEVKIRPEIVTLKKPVDISKGEGTHVKPAEWNELIAREDVVLLDTRNDYEYRNGTFKGAVNPGTEKFSELPRFVAENLDPEKHRRIAMFCTGGIRCEKFAPYMKELGFEEVYQLEGGILRYLEEMPEEESLWQGECFVFDDRVTVDHELKKGKGPDHSLERKQTAE